jgi:hypothetical protein
MKRLRRKPRPGTAAGARTGLCVSTSSRAEGRPWPNVGAANDNPEAVEVEAPETDAIILQRWLDDPVAGVVSIRLVCGDGLAPRVRDPRVVCTMLRAEIERRCREDKGASKERFSA